MVFRDELPEYVERSGRLIQQSPQMDEENTKRKLIEPLLEALGWDMLSADVELEYSVQMGTGTRKVDYALKLEETPVVFVEAKGCDTELTKKHASQLRSYMRQVGVDWGLLSNGREGEVFRRVHQSARPQENSLVQFSLADIEEHVDVLQALSKSKLESGESERIAESVQAAQEAADRLQTNKEQIAQRVTAVVTDEIGEDVSQEVEAQAKEFVDALVATLQSRSQPLDEPDTEPPDTTPSEYEIELRRNGVLVKRLSSEKQAETMGQVVEYLIQEEGLLEAIDLPYIPGTGSGGRALLNEEPVHTNGVEMRQYEVVADDYYLFTSLSATDKKRYLPELPAKVGLECLFSARWG